MSRSRDIAKFAGSASVFVYPTTDGSDGQTLTTDGAGNLLLEAASGAGVTSYTNASDLPLSGNTAGDLAYVNETARLYVNNGTGWYNVSLVNTNPSITSVQDANSNSTPFTLATDGTATVITITASDPEEVPLTYSYSVTSGSLTNGGGTTATVTQGTGSNTNQFTVTPTTTEAYAGSFTLTFTASDGINQATSANSFSLSFATIISNSSNTNYLLKSDASATDNQTDASSNSLTITEAGDLTSTAFTPYHPKGYSTYHAGAADDGFKFTSITAPASGNFTYECWIFAIEASNDAIMETRYSNTLQGGFTITAYTSSSIRIWDTTARVTATGLDYIGKWTHVAVVKNGSTTTLYVDGTSQGTTTAFGTHNDDDLHIGYSPHYSDGFSGYISDFRYTTNAVYTSDFTPPTERLTAISGTQVLTSHLPYIADGSTNAHSVTFNGSNSTKQFAPYDHKPYSKSSHGGSVYFDGTGDRLELASLADLSGGSYTIEGWYYFETDPNSAVHILWSLNDENTLGYAQLQTDATGNSIRLQQRGGSYTSTSTYDFSANNWYHIATVWDGTNMKVYVNGTAALSSTTNVIQNAGNGLTINGDGGGSYGFAGYVSDFRVVSSAVYTSNFTPPTEPLLAISGTQLQTCTNKHEIWEAASGEILTLNGNTTASTTQFKWSESVYFDGNGDSLQFTLSDNLQAMGRTGTECTIEAWVYLVSAPSENGTAIYSQGTAGSIGGSNIISFEIKGDRTVRAIVNGGYSSTTGCPISTGTVSTGQWTHLALVLYNQTWTIYINGTADGTGTGSYPSGTTHTTGYIGRVYYGADRTGEMYIEDFRISSGSARYTSNFTPPQSALEG